MTISSSPSIDVVSTMLAANGLPSEDIEPAFLAHFFVAEDHGEPQGIVGLQLLGPVALLRSLAVRHDARRRGLGTQLVHRAEAHARSHGVDAIYLLTTDAPAFFARLGYETTDRERAPDAVRQTRQFASLCCAAATCMRKRLDVRRVSAPVRLRPGSAP